MTDLPSLPDLPYEPWRETLLGLHLRSQLVGKLRLALHPPINHWWHVTLALTARGLSTGPIPLRGSSFEAELDLVDHVLVVRTGDGAVGHTPLGGRSIADFYRESMALLTRLGIEVTIRPTPYKCASQLPFPEDHEHRSYDPEAVGRAFVALRRIDAIFKRFRSSFLGKCSPVHLYWHSFDLAVTRFNGRAAPPMEGLDPVARAAYSHELISSGFWFGDDSFREPAFYTYASPSPPGLELEPLAPSSAAWAPRYGMTMAILRYDDLRRAQDPEGALLAFLQTSYEGAARRAGWDRDALELR